MRNYDEIIEGLDCCSQDGMCDICPYNISAHCYPDCLKQLCSDARNIIQRQDRYEEIKMTELLPCPFCGGEAKIIKFKGAQDGTYIKFK